MLAGPGRPWVSTNRARASQDACRPGHQGMPAGPGRHEVPARPGHQGMPVGLDHPWESIGPGHPGMPASRVIRGCLQAGSSGDACGARSSLGVNRARSSRDACRLGHKGMPAGPGRPWVSTGKVIPGCLQAGSSGDACGAGSSLGVNRPGRPGMPAGQVIRGCLRG